MLHEIDRQWQALWERIRYNDLAMSIGYVLVTSSCTLLVLAVSFIGSRWK